MIHFIFIRDAWLKLKLQFSLKYIIWSSRLKKVQLKFTTLQIIFNFPFECKQINQTIANNSTPYHQRRGKKSQSTFQTRHFPRIRKISPPSPSQKGRSTLLSQLYDFLHKQAFQLQNCAYIYISELSSVWVALVRPNRKSRVAALQMRDLPATIQRENPLEGVAAPFRSWLINLHTHFFVRTFATLLPIWTTVCIQYPIGISSFPIL